MPPGRQTESMSLAEEAEEGAEEDGAEEGGGIDSHFRPPPFSLEKQPQPLPFESLEYKAKEVDAAASHVWEAAWCLRSATR